MHKSGGTAFEADNVLYMEANKPNSKPTNKPTYEIVDAESIQFVKRGRKATLDNELVDALRTLGVGKALILRSLKQDPQAPTYANDKSRVASSIRTACKAAGITASIKWTPEGVPQVVR